MTTDKHLNDLNLEGLDALNSESNMDIKQRLNLQTGKIAWSELARFFASGKAIFVDASLDLIDVAAAMHQDNAARVKQLMEQNLVGAVNDAQASQWTEQNIELWAVVVSPWVLVQVPRKEQNSAE